MADVNGSLIVISGFSGAGKGTITRRLVAEYEGYALSVSATTREPRGGEVDGKDYFFVSTGHFEEMIARGELYEYAQFVDHYYGTPRAYVDRKRAEGYDVILEIEVQGALQIKKRFPEAILVFVTPPSVEVLRERLTRRGTESAEVIDKRIRRAAEEVFFIDGYDYILVNDDLDTAVRELHGILRAEHDRVRSCSSFINKIKNELQETK